MAGTGTPIRPAGRFDTTFCLVFLACVGFLLLSRQFLYLGIVAGILALIFGGMAALVVAKPTYFPNAPKHLLALAKWMRRQ